MALQLRVPLSAAPRGSSPMSCAPTAQTSGARSIRCHVASCRRLTPPPCGVFIRGNGRLRSVLPLDRRSCSISSGRPGLDGLGIRRHAAFVVRCSPNGGDGTESSLPKPLAWLAKLFSGGAAKGKEPSPQPRQQQHTSEALKSSEQQLAMQGDTHQPQSSEQHNSLQKQVAKPSEPELPQQLAAQADAQQQPAEQGQSPEQPVSPKQPGTHRDAPKLPQQLSAQADAEQQQAAGKDDAAQPQSSGRSHSPQQSSPDSDATPSSDAESSDSILPSDFPEGLPALIQASISANSDPDEDGYWNLGSVESLMKRSQESWQPHKELEREVQRRMREASGSDAGSDPATTPEEASTQASQQQQKKHDPGSWDSWQDYISQVEARAARQKEVRLRLSEASRDERFDDAVRWQKQLDELNRQDYVSAACQTVESALATERYEEAARIRDEASTYITGWWAGKGEDDNAGHLMYVSKGYSCYTGKIIKTSQITKVMDKLEEDELEEEDAEDYLLNLGAPLLELYLRPDEDTPAVQAGEGFPTLRSCATWLPPAAKASALGLKNSLNQVSLDAFEEQFKSMDWDTKQALFKQQVDSRAAQLITDSDDEEDSDSDSDDVYDVEFTAESDDEESDEEDSDEDSDEEDSDEEDSDEEDSDEEDSDEEDSDDDDDDDDDVEFIRQGGDDIKKGLLAQAQAEQDEAEEILAEFGGQLAELTRSLSSLSEYSPDVKARRPQSKDQSEMTSHILNWLQNGEGDESADEEKQDGSDKDQAAVFSSEAASSARSAQQDSEEVPNSGKDVKQNADSGEILEVDPSSLLRLYITDGTGDKQGMKVVAVVKAPKTSELPLLTRQPALLNFYGRDRFTFRILDAITEQPAAKETKKWFTLPSGDTEDAKVATTSKSVVREEVRGGTWPKWVTELAQGGKAPLPELEDLPMGYRNMFIDLIAELAEFDTQLNRLKDMEEADVAGDPELRQVLQPRVEELVNRHKAHQRMMHERETLLRKHSAEFEAARQRSGEAHQLTPKAQEARDRVDKIQVLSDLYKSLSKELQLLSDKLHKKAQRNSDKSSIQGSTDVKTGLRLSDLSAAVRARLGGSRGALPDPGNKGSSTPGWVDDLAGVASPGSGSSSDGLPTSHIAFITQWAAKLESQLLVQQNQLDQQSAKHRALAARHKKLVAAYHQAVTSLVNLQGRDSRQNQILDLLLQTVQEAMSEESASDSEESAQATPRLGDNVIVVKGGRTRGDRVQRGRASRGRAQKGGSLDDSTMERFIRFLDEAGKKLFSKGPQTPVYNPSFPVGGVTYTRVPSFSRTDVLQGVFLTSSVDAGNQALVLERSTDRHGQEWLVARKLTGDKNVPAGEVAFKANVTSKKRLSKKDSPFGELMSPIACYTGQGCLKRGSSKEPQWIPVQIMQFGPDNPILQGASLGVLWETPNKKHYMTTLRRINFLCQDKPPPERTINRGT